MIFHVIHFDQIFMEVRQFLSYILIFQGLLFYLLFNKKCVLFVSKGTLSEPTIWLGFETADMRVRVRATPIFHNQNGQKISKWPNYDNNVRPIWNMVLACQFWPIAEAWPNISISKREQLYSISNFESKLNVYFIAKNKQNSSYLD